MNSEAEWETLSVLASSFVEKYYSSLANGTLNGWYGKESFFATGVAPTSQSSGPYRIAGGDHIHEKLAKLASDLVGRKVSILQVDTQPSVAGSVMLSIWGAAISSVDVQYFHHCVILAAADESSFYIRNDIFQFMPALPQQIIPATEEPKELEQEEVTPAVVEEPKKSNKKEKQAAKKEKEAEKPEPVVEEPAPVEAEVTEEPIPEPEPEKEEPKAVQAPEPTTSKWASIATRAPTASSKPTQVVRVRTSPPPEPEPEVAPEPKEQPAKKPEKERKQKPACQLHFVLPEEVSFQEMKDALGSAGEHLLDVRQKPGRDNKNLVFVDFDTDVYQELRDNKPTIRGTKINVRPQQEKRKD